MARTRAALALVVVAAVAVALVSGGSAADPRTPPALPGMPPPFLSAAVLGDGGLTAGVDAYGDIVDLRASGPAGAASIDNPYDRQAAGTVPADTGIVPVVSVDGGPGLPPWRADSIHQSYLPGTNVLRTVSHFGARRTAIECAATARSLGCVAEAGRGLAPVTFAGGDGLPGVHLDDGWARRILRAAADADRRWLSRAAPLGSGAPSWARRLYGRSLLAIHALTGDNGAVAAGARDGWAYVWPRDASAVAIALADAGYRPEARRVARFLLRLDLGAAARFDEDGEAVAGRAAEGDAGGWVASAARASGVPAELAPEDWRGRPDYQEKTPGDYLGNALASNSPILARNPRSHQVRHALHGELDGIFGGPRGELVRQAGEPASGLDSAAAWAVRPFPQPRLFGAVRRTIAGLERAQEHRFGAGAARFGLVPSEDWPDADPWTAPTAWSAWSLATLARDGEGAPAAGRDRAAALRLVADLRRAATPTGLLAERVDAGSGIPRSTTPLAWSEAFAALALRQLWPGRHRRQSQ